jgi:hypothetical protein
MSYLESDLETLFKEAGQAHREAFASAGGEDPEWPLWYAEHLHEALQDLLDASFTRSELVYLLVHAENDRAAVAPGADWARYYAIFFAQRYG